MAYSKTIQSRWRRARNHVLYVLARTYFNLPVSVQKKTARLLSRVLPGVYGRGTALWADSLQPAGPNPLLRFLRRYVRQVAPNPFGSFLWNVTHHWLIEGRKLRMDSRRKGITYPALIQLSVTTKCNYRCVGCYAAGWTQNVDLDYDRIRKLFDEGRQYGCTYYTVLGGEPFAYPRILDLFYEYPDFYFQVYTNGSLITEDTAAHLERAGNAQIMIGIEGLEPETDWRRGKGAYKSALRTMERLRKAGVPYGVGITVTTRNFDTVLSDRFVEEMLRHGVLFMWFFWFQPYGDQSHLDLILDGEQRYRLWRRINEIRERHPVLSADMLNDAAVAGCLASSGLSLNITPSGAVEPCAQMHFSQANLQDAPLRDIIRNSPFLQGILDFYRRGEKRCLVQDCTRELGDLIVRCNARDDTFGRDLQALERVGEYKSRFRYYTREEMDDFPDPFLPFKRFFFDCLKPGESR